jgi:hypothetical protein
MCLRTALWLASTAKMAHTPPIKQHGSEHRPSASYHLDDTQTYPGS